MLELHINKKELFDEASNRFKTESDVVLKLEHSLVSLSKWESKFQKPFLSAGPKTSEETLEYIRFMTITPGVSSETFKKLDAEHFDLINAYISSKETATTFGALPERRGRGETITSE